MAKGYWIARIDVADAESYKAYVAAATPAYQKYGAKFLVRGGRCEAVEGPGRARNVVVEFESYDIALACYRSPEYQAAAEFRRKASMGEILVVEGA
ncbi:MAG: DUF1330 domain-containing protein [Alphaproteobacteria bacterium]|jgi:uncharacterized protein (DUF1330 family)|nr:DUF1330 domain-containing protein [Alphaproteobacteria bacterium]